MSNNTVVLLGLVVFVMLVILYIMRRRVRLGKKKGTF